MFREQRAGPETAAGGGHGYRSASGTVSFSDQWPAGLSHLDLVHSAAEIAHLPPEDLQEEHLAVVMSFHHSLIPVLELIELKTPPPTCGIGGLANMS